MKTSDGNYRADIDGLRGVAILCVIAFHVGMPHVGGGYVGVDIFFVISGYLISSHIYRDLHRNQFSLRAFYERRAKRILPAFLAVAAVTTMLACILLAPKELQRYATQAVSAVTSTSNIYFWMRSNYFSKAADTQPMLMTWSLAIEEQFYLLFPLLIIALRRRRRTTLLLTVGALSLASLVCAELQVRRYPTAAFFLLPSRWWELGCGTLLGLYEVSARPGTQASLHWRQALSLAGLILLLLPVFGYHAGTRFPGLAAVPPVLGAACLIRSRGSWVNRTVLECRPLVLIGVISYSWYLWHWPLLSFAHVATGDLLPVPAGVVVAALAFALACGSYKWVETPFRRARTGPWTLPRYAFTALCTLLALGVLYLSHGLPLRYPRATVMEKLAMDPDPSLCLEQGSAPGHLPAACRPDTRLAPTLAILGDSHASALARYLRGDARLHGWQVTEYTKTRCPQLGSVARASFLSLQDGEQCRRYSEAALKQVLNDPNIREVLLAGFWSAPFGGTQDPGRYTRPDQNARELSVEQSWRNFAGGLDEVTQQLEAHGKRVAVALDVPHYEFDPLLLELGEAIPARAMAGHLLVQQGEFASGVVRPWTDRDLRANATVADRAHRDGALVLDLSAPLCHGETCDYVRNGSLLYMDFNHLTTAGVRIALGSAKLFPALFPTPGDRASTDIHASANPVKPS